MRSNYATLSVYHEMMVIVQCLCDKFYNTSLTSEVVHYAPLSDAMYNHKAYRFKNTPKNVPKTIPLVSKNAQKLIHITVQT